MREVKVKILPQNNEITDIWYMKKGNKIIASAGSAYGKREKNDDYYGVILNKHDHKLIMAVICDGVGGYSDSDQASAYVVKELGKFFRNVAANIVNSVGSFIKLLENKIYEINKNLPAGATTLTVVVITKTGIIVGQAGDTRAYGLQGNNIIQLTDDQSKVWDIFSAGILNKDDLRFVKGNNVITNALDGSDYARVDFKFIKGYPYKNILLTTDGVHDIIADSEFIEIFKMSNNETAIYNILKKSIDGPVDSLDENLKNKIYDIFCEPFLELTPGKDNATAILLEIPKRK